MWLGIISTCNDASEQLFNDLASISLRIVFHSHLDLDSLYSSRWLLSLWKWKSCPNYTYIFSSFIFYLHYMMPCSWPHPESRKPFKTCFSCYIWIWRKFIDEYTTFGYRRLHTIHTEKQWPTDHLLNFNLYRYGDRNCIKGSENSGRLFFFSFSRCNLIDVTMKESNYQEFDNLARANTKWVIITNKAFRGSSRSPATVHKSWNMLRIEWSLLLAVNRNKFLLWPESQWYKK